MRARTAFANGQRYVSCMVLSSILELMASIVTPSTVEGFLWISCSLAAAVRDMFAVLTKLALTDVMLRARLNAGTLNTMDCLFHQHAGEVGIGTKPLPVASPIRRSAEWTDRRTQSYMGALLPKLCTHVGPALADQCAIPRGSCRHARRKD